MKFVLNIESIFEKNHTDVTFEHHQAYLFKLLRWINLSLISDGIRKRNLAATIDINSKTQFTWIDNANLNNRKGKHTLHLSILLDQKSHYKEDLCKTQNRNMITFKNAVVYSSMFPTPQSADHPNTSQSAKIPYEIVSKLIHSYFSDPLILVPQLFNFCDSSRHSRSNRLKFRKEHLKKSMVISNKTFIIKLTWQKCIGSKNNAKWTATSCFFY